MYPLAPPAYLSGYRVGAEFVRIEVEDVALIDHFIASANNAIG
jgi:hypothetical protein